MIPLAPYFPELYDPVDFHSRYCNARVSLAKKRLDARLKLPLLQAITISGRYQRHIRACCQSRLFIWSVRIKGHMDPVVSNTPASLIMRLEYSGRTSSGHGIFVFQKSQLHSLLRVQAGRSDLVLIPRFFPLNRASSHISHRHSSSIVPL